jgi:hypothetical protein
MPRRSANSASHFALVSASRGESPLDGIDEAATLHLFSLASLDHVGVEHLQPPITGSMLLHLQLIKASRNLYSIPQ